MNATRILFDYFPGLEDKISVEKFVEERLVLIEAAFRTVEPMKGAVALVQGLVSRLHDL